jgi:NAD(P)-dependent dehydrogenase (short-subunit alcohol dehydrogenase family)
MAEQGAQVIMACRDHVRGYAARAEVAKYAAGPDPVLFFADLSSQAQIHELSEEIHRQFRSVDVVLNNAGAIFAHRELTCDQFEKTFATNHLAPFLLTHLLFDLVSSAPAGRIVNVTSESHSGVLDFNNLQGEWSYDLFDAYSRSKLCNILFTYELARRLAGSTITANCVSPGPTVTRFGDNLSGLQGLYPLVMRRIPFLLRYPEQGAKTLDYAASSPSLERVSGRFFMRRGERRTKPITYDENVARRLWSKREELCSTTLKC